MNLILFSAETTMERMAVKRHATPRELPIASDADLQER